ncbi:hypothetical protein CWR53_10155 [Pseudomonas sp. SGAir0191]|uniref:DUF7079 family protein n=1 Tax=Pseudomonas sp. SGAir0191 TaxID=2217867 RepID=UPI0010FC61B2|nr:hypothetical protein [Pseudomonas sp. SGAir0191]AUA32926.2 hypothetical protein CWR53_10155 [Pseudomonas sp. SGAir0191]
MQTIDKSRLQAWQALSQFFLDTELTESSLAWVARVMAQSPYRLDQLHSILWHELYPALHWNLRSMAGEWAGWTDEFLVEHVKVRPFAPAVARCGAVGDEIAQCWERTVAKLSVQGLGRAE